mmetsp:Transcript_35783/g.70103  ORF Transcript_35783/g.70103 Transcript_35783/m.70103 type:complete len:279 (-) Transcript_35783:180-1016(-)
MICFLKGSRSAAEMAADLLLSAAPKLPADSFSICFARLSTLVASAEPAAESALAAFDSSFSVSFCCFASSLRTSATCAMTFSCSADALSCLVDSSLCADARLSSCLSRRETAAADLSFETVFSRALSSRRMFLFSETIVLCCCCSFATSADMAPSPAPPGPCTIPKSTKATTATRTASSMYTGCISCDPVGSSLSASLLSASDRLPAAFLPGPAGASSCSAPWKFLLYHSVYVFLFCCCSSSSLGSSSAAACLARTDEARFLEAGFSGVLLAVFMSKS